MKASSADFAADKKLQREVDRLAVSIRKFRVDSQRFFAGDLKLPPDELREKITSDLRRLRSSSLKSAAANFRLSSLEAKFQSHLDLFGRRLRKRELSEVQAASELKKPSPDPTQGVVVGPKASSPAIEALYNGLYRRNPSMDLERFRSYIDRQSEAIRAKTGCREIQYRIAVQDGKMKLKARPIRQRSST